MVNSNNAGIFNKHCIALRFYPVRHSSSRFTLVYKTDSGLRKVTQADQCQYGFKSNINENGTNYTTICSGAQIVFTYNVITQLGII